MRFLHTADLHLGMEPDKARPWGLARAEAVRSSLKRICDICVSEEIDLLLIAGDLFHHPPGLKELREADYLFSRLPHTRVCMIAGNHDHLRPGSVYSEFQFSPNVTLLSSPELSSVFYPQWKLEVHGFSYDSMELPEDRLTGLSAPQDGRKHILLAHGGDEKHCPFRPGALKAQGWDYVALGHLHRPAYVPGGRIANPGSPEPLDASETGSHGFFIGTMKGSDFDLQWRNFSDTEYTVFTLHVNPTSTQASLEQLLQLRLQQAPEQILEVNLIGHRAQELSIDTDALLRLGRISAVHDKTIPDYPLEEWKKRPEQSLITRFAERMDDSEDEIRTKALYYGLDALLAPDRRKGVLK